MRPQKGLSSSHLMLVLFSCLASVYVMGRWEEEPNTHCFAGLQRPSPLSRFGLHAAGCG